jgi:hypothetical protein
MDYNTKVNRPTTDDAKDADVSRKLQIYGILKAFQAGKVPSVSTTKSCFSPIERLLTSRMNKLISH